MSTTKLIPLLEKIKDMLGVTPTEQTVASQDNKVSTSAAKAKLAELAAKSKKGVTATTTVNATGSKKRR